MKNIRFISKVLRFRFEDGWYYTMSPFAKLIRVNETGYQMLLLCEKVQTSLELVNAVQRYFGIEKRSAEIETEKFLDIMLRCGLIVQSELICN